MLLSSILDFFSDKGRCIMLLNILNCCYFSDPIIVVALLYYNPELYRSQSLKYLLYISSKLLTHLLLNLLLKDT